MPEPTLLDTSPLRDQRTMVYVTGPQEIHQSIDDVERAWQRWADEQGLPTRLRHGDYSTELKRSRKTLQVYVSGGKWITGCPECNDGVAAWPFHERGCCLGCGTIYRLEYPPEDEVKEVARLLTVRPEQHRNYLPQQGMTLDDLRRENEIVYQPAQLEQGSIDLGTLREALTPKQFDKLLRHVRGEG